MDSRKLYTDLSELLEESLLGLSDPVILRRIFLLHTRELFSDPNNYANYSELKELLYTDNKSTRTLDVDLDFVYDSEEISKKPAIYVGTGPINFEKQVVNNSAGTPSDSAFVTTMQARTAINIKHVSNHADVSLMLGALSTNYFGAIRSSIFDNFPDILRYEIKQIAGPNLIEGTKIRSFQTNVTIDLAFDALWSIVRESHLIKSVSIDTRPA